MQKQNAKLPTVAQAQKACDAAAEHFYDLYDRANPKPLANGSEYVSGGSVPGADEVEQARLAVFTAADVLNEARLRESKRTPARKPQPELINGPQPNWG